MTLAPVARVVLVSCLLAGSLALVGCTQTQRAAQSAQSALPSGSADPQGAASASAAIDASASSDAAASPSASASDEAAMGDAQEGVSAEPRCPDPQTWMACMFPDGQRRLLSITMPGSHDSGTYGIHATSPFVAQCAAFPGIAHTFDFFNIIKSWAVTQTASMGDQARAGVRYFDVRPAWANPEKFADEEWTTCHSLAGATIKGSIGKSSDLQAFARSHPQEVIIIDLSHWYPAGKNAADLRQVINDELGDIAYSSGSASLDSVTLADIRATGRNVVIVGLDDFAGGLIWPRSSLYTPWQDNTEPARQFWDGKVDRAFFALVDREAGNLTSAQAAGKLTVLNYIWDSGCPVDIFGNAYCIAAYSAPGSLLSATRTTLVPGVAGFVKSMRAKVAKAGLSDRPFILMRDAVDEGSNAPIWEVNR